MPATKEQIADEFARHVERFGLQKTTVEEVAAELGISKRTVYQHFGSKREIYAYVVSRVAAEQRADLERAIASQPGPRERLETLLRMIFAASRAHILETSASEWRDQYEIAVEAFREGYGSLIRDLVAQGAATGEFALTDGVLVDRLLGAVLIEYTFMVREDPDYDADEAVVAAALRFVERS